MIHIMWYQSARLITARFVQLKISLQVCNRLADLFLLGSFGGKAMSWQDLHLGELRRKIGSDTAGKFSVD